MAEQYSGTYVVSYGSEYWGNTEETDNVAIKAAGILAKMIEKQFPGVVTIEREHPSPLHTPLDANGDDCDEEIDNWVEVHWTEALDKAINA